MEFQNNLRAVAGGERRVVNSDDVCQRRAHQSDDALRISHRLLFKAFTDGASVLEIASPG